LKRRPIFARRFSQAVRWESIHFLSAMLTRKAQGRSVWGISEKMKNWDWESRTKNGSKKTANAQSCAEQKNKRGRECSIEAQGSEAKRNQLCALRDRI
jgi:hypothetical protein